VIDVRSLLCAIEKAATLRPPPLLFDEDTAAAKRLEDPQRKPHADQITGGSDSEIECRRKVEESFLPFYDEEEPHSHI
jgi:hypothetical protein